MEVEVQASRGGVATKGCVARGMRRKYVGKYVRKFRVEVVLD